MELQKQAEALLTQRFGEEKLLALATAENNIPTVRQVNACYVDGAFYTLTARDSSKLRQIAQNPAIALSGFWFSGQGLGKDLGWAYAPENAALAQRLLPAFERWLAEESIDLPKEAVHLLQLRLTQGRILDGGQAYPFSFPVPEEKE